MMKKWVLLMACLLPISAECDLAHGQSLRRLLGKFARRTASNGDDLLKNLGKNADAKIFTRSTDDLVRRMDTELDILKRFDVRAKKLGLDNDLIRSVRKLPKKDQARFLHLAGEIKPILETPGRGLRVVSLLDVDGLYLAKVYGDEVVEATARLGDRRFLKVVRRTGEHGVEFFRKWIKPHWKKWAGTAALTAFLAEPDAFIDAAGNLTEHASEQFTRLGIKVASAPFTGVATGIIESFKESPWRLFVGGISLLAILLYILKRIGKLPTQLIGWLRSGRKNTPTTKVVVKNERMEELLPPGVDDE